MERREDEGGEREKKMDRVKEATFGKEEKEEEEEVEDMSENTFPKKNLEKKRFRKRDRELDPTLTYE